jgi:Tol biopolymer transport system component
MIWGMNIGTHLAGGVIAGLIAASPLPAVAEITQITDLPTTQSVGVYSIDGDGRYIAFDSDGNIGGLNPTSSTNVFVYETLTGQFSRITSKSGSEPSISADGRWVAFTSSEDYVRLNADGSDEIFKYDRKYHRVYQVTNDRQANGSSSLASISEDGKRLAFQTNSNLRGGNPNNCDVVYVRRGGNYPISRDPNCNGSYTPVISADGNFVSFISSSNLTGHNPNNAAVPFIYDMHARANHEIVFDSEANGQSWAPSISADGRYTLFMSSSNINLSNPGNDDVMVLFDRRSGKSILNQGANGFFSVDMPTIDGDGEWIAFQSSADLTGGNTDGNVEIFLYNRSRKVFTQLTDSIGCVNSAPKISGDASRIVFLSNCNYTGQNADGSNELFTSENPAVALVFHSEGPMWMEVRDPNDLITNPNVNLIPRATYTTGDFDGSGQPEVRVVIPQAVEGTYSVTLYSNPGALLTDPVTVDGALNGLTLQLASDTVGNIVGSPIWFSNQGFARKTGLVKPLAGSGSKASISARVLHGVPATGPVKVRLVAGDADVSFDLGLIENFATTTGGSKVFNGVVGGFKTHMAISPRSAGAWITFTARNGDLSAFAGTDYVAMVMVVQMGLYTDMEQWRFVRAGNGNLMLR